MFSFFTKRKCCVCSEFKKVSFHEEIIIGLDRLYYNFYCEDCGAVRKEMLALEEKKKLEEFERKIKRDQDNKRLEYLKKEIERVETERKAKEYGIVYSNE